MLKKYIALFIRTQKQKKHDSDIDDAFGSTISTAM